MAAWCREQATYLFMPSFQHDGGMDDQTGVFLKSSLIRGKEKWEIITFSVLILSKPQPILFFVIENLGKNGKYFEKYVYWSTVI